MTADENGSGENRAEETPRPAENQPKPETPDAFDLPGFLPPAAPRNPEPRRSVRPFKPRPKFDAREGKDRGAFRPQAARPPGRFAPPGDRRGSRPPERGFDDRMAPEVRKFLLLRNEKGRQRESRFLIEGAKNVADVAAVLPGMLHLVLAARGFVDTALLETLRRQRVHTREVHPRDLAALCDTETPQGVVAVANFAALRPDWNAAHYVTLLDGVQDPGNVGAILRTAAALGLDAVVLGKGTCDAYNPKVVRASLASLLRLPVETGEDLAAKIHFLRTKGFSVVATSPHAKITLGQAKLRRKVALLFGNEGAGVGENLLDQADAAVRIPMRGPVESLNVSVAHGLLTYELLRLRDAL